MTCFWSLVDPYLAFRNTPLVLPATFVKLLLSSTISADLLGLFNQTKYKPVSRPKCTRQMIIVNYTRRPQNTGSYIVMKCVYRWYRCTPSDPPSPTALITNALSTTWFSLAYDISSVYNTNKMPNCILLSI